METIFKQPVETAPIQEAPPVETRNLVEGKEDVAISDKSGIDDSLEVWENENKRKYGVDYFNIRELAHEFPLKAPFGAVDKFVKSELNERGWQSNPANYEKLLREIEAEIGTERMSQYNRMQRLFNYIQTVKKYRDIKKKKESFRSLSDGL